MRNKFLLVLLMLLLLTSVVYADQSFMINGYKYFVADDGTYYTEVKGNEITWLYSEFEGNHTWYGLDNSNGMYEPGSRFWVKRTGLDDILNQYRQDNNSNPSSFLFGITDPDGYEIHDRNTKLYIQIGEGWDREDVKALFNNTRTIDEPFECSFVIIDDAPERGEYALIKGVSTNFFGSAFGSGRVWIIIAFAVVILIFVAIAIYKNKQKKNK